MLKCKTYAGECKRGCTDKCAAENAYYPSNGTEGCGFMSEFCEHCIHDNPDPESGKKCEIILLAMCYDPTEPQYPREWIYNSLGHPTCTKYVNWDWGNDGDPDDDDNPKRPPPPPDPRQLNLFPLFHPELNDRTSIPAATHISSHH